MTLFIKMVRYVLTVIFVLSALAKLAGLPFEIAAFTRWGYPVWFMYVTGGIELICGLGLLWKSVSRYANIGLIGVMLGAIGTHIVHQEYVLLCVATGIFVLLVFYLRQSRA